MTKTNVVAALGALAQQTRLDILRLLVERGPQGMPAGEIGARLKLPSPTLSFHLNQLRHSGLVTSRRQSRLVIYSAKFRTINGVVEFLTENCCAGQARSSAPATSASAGPGREFNVLFLCTHNSARSIMAECAMNRWGGGKFRAFSAGSKPRGAVHPITLEVLEEFDYATGELRSKDWNEFARPDGPPLDFVFTLCDRAAAEICPTWPGQPIRAHWGIEDPVAMVATGAARRKAFVKVYAGLEQRIRIFTAVPIETLERFALERWVTELGKLNLAA
ncbi:MAG TPA: metalloregulator ArsR/SmtB family transcription factor [Candidatus Binataceae bacterium]|nr:metalloregulator ArsR/SmtB family transcription factor [Candidatus Binataceae bacterium]